MTERKAAYLKRYAAEVPLDVSPRRLNFYGHFVRKHDARRWRISRAHVEAIRENTLRERLKAAVGA